MKDGPATRRARAAFAGPLRHRDFRLLWIGHSASAIGDRIITVALALLVIDLTGSPSDVGLVLAAQTLPLVAFVLLGGVWADRLPRQRVMIASDAVRFVLHALLALLIFTDAVQVWHIVVIEALFGTARAFFRPAFGGLLPQTVPEHELQSANALANVSHNVAELLGPVLATGLVLGVGAGWAFAIDAATYVLSAVCLLGVRARERGVAGAPASVLEDLREGWQAVRSRAWVWATLLGFSAALLTALAPWYVLGPVVARETYGDVAVFGWLAAAIGGGTVLGTIVALRWRPLRPMRAGLLLCLAWPLSCALFAVGAPLAPLIATTVVAGAGLAIFEVWWLTALAERIPPHLLSRVTSYDHMGSLALLPLGYLLSGPAAEALGAPEVLLGGAVLAGLALALALLPRATRQLARIDPGALPGGGVESR